MIRDLLRNLTALRTDNRYFKNPDKMSETLLQSELCLNYPPWFEALKRLICGLFDLQSKNQQAKKGLLRTDIDHHIW